jgi:hypothetical protein
MNSADLIPHPVFSTKFRSKCMALCQHRTSVFCLVGTMPCSTHVAKFSLCELCHYQSQTWCCKLYS